MELSLDLSLAFVPRTVSEIFNIKVKKEGSQKMEDFLKRLEDEMRKIEAFKRELPLCTILVNDAITRLKEEVKEGIRKHDEAVVEEWKPFMKTSYGGNWSWTKGKENGDNKKNWMSSVQLWNAETKRRSEEDDRSVPENPIQATNKCVSKRVMMRDDKEVSQVPSLSLMTPTFESNQRSGSPLITRRVEVKVQRQPQQNPRKQRRCWSPELHRRFVDALQQLGGPQGATPKQIRELMQVGGLTNDEVKSHLQKYRLHVRRPQVSSVGKANNSGLCMMAQDQCGDNNKSKGHMSQSGSPQGPLFLGGSRRNSMDKEEDEQSDCHNWKGGLHQQPEADV